MKINLMARMSLVMQDCTLSLQKALSNSFHVLSLHMGQAKGNKKGFLYNLYFGIWHVILNII